MILRSVWSYLLGYVIIKAKGEKVEELLNRATREGIPVWNCRQIAPGFYVISLSVHSFRRLGPLVRRLGLDIRILQRVGLPFLLVRAFSRPGFLLGIGAFCVLLYYMSGFIWFVDVQGQEKVEPALLLEKAAEVGLRPGVRRDELDLSEIEHHLITTVPNLAWVGVTLQGTRACIEVVEKVVVNKDEVAPGDVIASKSGLIEQIIPFVGVPLVREGDTVVKGQVLITGRPHYLDETGEVRFTKDGLYQRAEGIIKARVWYEARVDVPLVQVKEVPTGRQTRSWSVTLGEKTLHIGSKVPDYQYWIEETRQIPVGWHQLTIPVQVVEHRFVEVERQTSVLSRHEASQLGVKEAKEAIAEQVLEGAPVSFTVIETQEIDSSEGERMQVLVVGETVENIARPAKIQ